MMLTQADIHLFRSHLPENMQIALDVMGDLEPWVVDDAPEPQELIKKLSSVLATGIDPLMAVSAKNLLKGIMHVNSYRYVILLQALGNREPEKLAELIADKDGESNIYVIAYLFRTVFLLRHQIFIGLFGEQRREEIISLINEVME
jgi:hypothetical protein